MLNYTEETQNTYIQILTVWEKMTIENWDFLRFYERYLSAGSLIYVYVLMSLA
jgi:hypothetical protein